MQSDDAKCQPSFLVLISISHLQIYIMTLCNSVNMLFRAQSSTTPSSFMFKYAERKSINIQFQGFDMNPYHLVLGKLI